MAGYVPGAVGRKTSARRMTPSSDSIGTSHSTVKSSTTSRRKEPWVAFMLGILQSVVDESLVAALSSLFSSVCCRIVGDPRHAIYAAASGFSLRSFGMLIEGRSARR